MKTNLFQGQLERGCLRRSGLCTAQPQEEPSRNLAVEHGLAHTIGVQASLFQHALDFEREPVRLVIAQYREHSDPAARLSPHEGDELTMLFGVNVALRMSALCSFVPRQSRFRWLRPWSL
jgi:hypothetical protein